jgi:methionyl-tRNA synthetase
MTALEQNGSHTEIGTSSGDAIRSEARALEPRADLLKCSGAQWDQCATCSRQLAPPSERNQRWIEPSVVSACSYYANIEVFRSLYTSMEANVIAILEANRQHKASSLG